MVCHIGIDTSEGMQEKKTGFPVFNNHFFNKGMQVIKEYKTRAFPSFKMNDYLYKKSDNIFNFNEVYYL